MKSYMPIIIAFLIGVVLVSSGWGGALYVGLVLFGLMTMVVLCALIWTSIDKRNGADGHAQVAGDKKDLT